ncbi:UPF0161 protein At3g09310 [Elaeis guineensis]|uniref:UPF0161 protein At3g09310 isoform X1 n=1 Tax=Elaeis guineensis var. tenera TaxID=51953 RepID=A0A6I9S0C4_ELAGV|nr:UPF0161 protein At3g09310 isoform X1 [Elaeis guineensis]
MAFSVVFSPSQSPLPSFRTRFDLAKSLPGRSNDALRLPLRPLGRVPLPTSLRVRSSAADGPKKDSDQKGVQDEEVVDLGVRAALSVLKFYKREISPLLPRSCRYVPTCSEYSMQAYKRYGVVKGTILTAWRLCRCNPLGGHGFDPPRWFDEGEPLDH